MDQTLKKITKFENSNRNQNESQREKENKKKNQENSELGDNIKKSNIDVTGISSKGEGRGDR